MARHILMGKKKKHIIKEHQDQFRLFMPGDSSLCLLLLNISNLAVGNKNDKLHWYYSSNYGYNYA